MSDRNLVVLNNPVINQYLSILRNRDTDSYMFRQIIKKLSMLLVYPSSESLESVEAGIIKTPFGMVAENVLVNKLALFPILRSGLLISQVFEEMLPVSFVGMLGIRRNRETLSPEIYYSNIPNNLEDCDCFILDPMLATGKIICKSVSILKENKAKNIIVVSVISTENGISKVFRENPGVKIYTCHIDSNLTSSGYIMPGLGDVGDRAFGMIDNARIHETVDG